MNTGDRKELAKLDYQYGASLSPRSTHPYRATFRSRGDEDYTAYFQTIESVERFAKREYIHDVGVTITFIVLNLGEL